MDDTDMIAYLQYSTNVVMTSSSARRRNAVNLKSTDAITTMTAGMAVTKRTAQNIGVRQTMLELIYIYNNFS